MPATWTGITLGTSSQLLQRLLWDWPFVHWEHVGNTLDSYCAFNTGADHVWGMRGGRTTLPSQPSTWLSQDVYCDEYEEIFYEHVIIIYNNKKITSAWSWNWQFDWTNIGNLIGRTLAIWLDKHWKFDWTDIGNLIGRTLQFDWTLFKHCARATVHGDGALASMGDGHWQARRFTGKRDGSLASATVQNKCNATVVEKT